ncbi:MAG: nitroreductase family protein, partial [Desulfobacterales bacterium]|nr:nitroreductase family protein [Desulfobacterales bacterium]
TKKQLEEVTPYKFAVKAPVTIACCADTTVLDKREQRVKELLESGAFTDVEMDDPSSGKYQKSLTEFISQMGYLAMNVAIAVEHMVLRATDLGLGSCWIGRIDTEKTRQILGLSDDCRVICLLPVGYPAQAPAQRPRLAKEDILLKT